MYKPIARFWGTRRRCIYFKINLRNGDNIESFGQTKGLNEPHEFSKLVQYDGLVFFRR